MDFKIDDVSSHWFKVVTVAGLAILVAAIIAGDGAYRVVGLGIFLWGIGEFINHPFNPQAKEGETKRPRKDFVSGWLVTALGVILAAVGIVLLLTDQSTNLPLGINAPAPS